MKPEDRVDRFVDSLIHNRRPKRFVPENDEAEALLAAAELSAGRAGADLPSRGFVDGLHSRLEKEVARVDAIQPAWSRRRVFQLTGAAAAAVLAGIGLDRLMDREPASPAAPQQAVLDVGDWVAVVDAASVPAGHAVRFTSGAVEGFVINNAGHMEALSAVCTHMGCILKFNQGAGRLDCPCHGASFKLDGSPINREYLASLTRLSSRVRDGKVEVRSA